MSHFKKNGCKFLSSHYKTKHQFTPDWCRNLKTNRYHQYDFLLEDHKIIVELDGKHHFEQLMNWESSEITREKDIFKMVKAVKNGYHMIRILQHKIWYNEYDWETYLQDKIKYLINNTHSECVIIFPEEKEGDKFSYKNHIEGYTKLLLSI